MYNCSRIIIVEGKYDKIKLSSLVDANILVCDGFQIYKNEEMKTMMHTLAKKQGAVLLLDSDVAGFQIRSYLRNFLKDCDVIDAFIPDIYGKEKRKIKASKEGKLGVEGVPAQVLIHCLKSAGVFEELEVNADPITRLDMYNLGLIGKEDSNALRAALLKVYNLPQNLPPKSLLKVLNQISGREELQENVQNLLTKML